MVNMNGSAYYYNRLQTARQEHDRLQQDYQQRQQELQEMQGCAADTLHQIRAIVIEAIRNGERFDWTDVDEKVAALFKNLHDRQDALVEQLQRDEAQAQQANDIVSRALADHREALQALLHLDQGIETSIGELPEVRELLRKQDDILLLSGRLKTRKAEAEADAGSKRQAYEADRFFQYLWVCAYNTPRYKGSLLSRRFDRWLAEACAYNDNQRQYELLLAIPARLQAAIDESTEQLAALKTQVSGYRTRAAEQMQRAALQNSLDRAAEILVKSKAGVADIVARMQKSKDELGIIQGSGHQLQQSITALVDNALDRQNLKRFVLATLSQVDDELLLKYEQEYRQTQQMQSDALHLSVMLGAVVNEITEMDNAYSHARALEAAHVSTRARRYSDRSGGSTRVSGFSGNDGGFGGGDFSSGGDFGGSDFGTGGDF